MGAIIDRMGTRIGYTLSIAIWSIFGMLHAAVRPAFSLIGFSLARFGLGFGFCPRGTGFRSARGVFSGTAPGEYEDQDDDHGRNDGRQ